MNIEWLFTILFSVEYLLRVISAKNPAKYIFSLFGIIDLVSVLPLYISLVFKGEEILQVIRLLRLIRIFSRGLKIIKKLNRFSKSLDLKHHLSSQERVILFFRPTRKKYFLRYLLALILLIFSLTEIFFNLVNMQLLTILSYFILLFSLIILIRIEIKILSVKYIITSERIFSDSGIFKGEFKSIGYQYITDISLKQTLWNKISDTGTIIIHTAGGEANNLEIRNISEPLKIKKIISDGIAYTMHNLSKNR